jgi:hypothetical protein
MSALLAGARADIDHPITGKHNSQIVFDEYDRVPGGHQGLAAITAIDQNMTNAVAK